VSPLKSLWKSDNLQMPKGKGNCVLCAIAAERACQKCGDFYCSEDCQKMDWQRHRYICFPMPALVYPQSFSAYQSKADKTKVGEVGPAPVSTPTPLSTNPIRLNGKIQGQKHSSNTAMPPSHSLVFLTGFRSGNRCHIRDACETADKAFNEISEKINAVGKELPRLMSAKVGDLCLTHHNGMFKRAHVLSCYGKESANVLLMDYGSIKSSSLSELRTISPDLISLPCFSKVVQLKNVPHYNYNDNIAKFLSHFEGEKYVAIYIKTPGHIRVELFHPETKTSLNAQINEFYRSKPNGQNLSTDQKTTDELPQTINKEPPKKPTEPAQSVQKDAPKNLNLPNKFPKIPDLMELQLKLNSPIGCDDQKAKISDADKINECQTALENGKSAEQNSVIKYDKELLKSLESNDMDLLKSNRPDCINNIREFGKIGKPFEFRQFTIASRDGIDVLVVDNSNITRGIFGAFDSTYADEFSTLHSRLSEITDLVPYKPAYKEFVLARSEGSWYRGKVEEIKVLPEQQTQYRVMFLDFTNVDVITEKDIRQYPLEFTTPCSTNICVIEGFPHKPNMDQILYLSKAIKTLELLHVDSVTYIKNVAMIKSHALIEKLNNL
ncbi:hypothetical protein KR009_006247, partial [Drosophila setifemur]